MLRLFSKKDFSILIGNALDHYDSIVYGLLVPIIAPLFFPDFDPVVQLILGYSVLTTSLITRPVGSIIFGNVARKYGPISGLSYSLIGVSIAMVALGCLPTYADIGWFSPLGLMGARMVKGIFSAGETTIAKLYIMDEKTSDQALTISYYYQSSSSLGAIVASGIVTLLLLFPTPDAWRLCFLIGGVLAGFGYFLRRFGNPPLENSVPKDTSFFHLKSLWNHKADITRIALATAFGYITALIPLVFMNSFVPLITSITLDVMMLFNTILLSFIIVGTPLIGKITGKFSGQSVMTLASVILMLSIIPLFVHLPGASLEYVIFVRVWIVFWGIVFMCPMNFWFKSLFPSREQYLLVGVGGALGATLLGQSLIPLCLWLWSITKLSYAPALYLAVLMGITAYAIYTYDLTVSRKAVKGT
jgi:MFS family permease